MCEARSHLFAVALLVAISSSFCFDGLNLVGQWATEDSWIDSIINSQEIFRIDQSQWSPQYAVSWSIYGCAYTELMYILINLKVHTCFYDLSPAHQLNHFIVSTSAVWSCNNCC